MPFWSGETLKARLRSERLITHFDENRVDCAAYTLRMGRQYYLSADDTNVNENKLRALGAGECVAIPPGQFAFLLTEERVTVPPDSIAFISTKTEIKFRGLVNVSGFHVDPGFSGPLKFAVFNAGPATICIRQGEDCFLIWYASLDLVSEEIKTSSQNEKYERGITTRDVSAISGSVRSLNVLANQVDQLSRTQIWMKVVLFGLGLSVPLMIGLTIFLAQEGVGSFIAKAMSGTL